MTGVCSGASAATANLTSCLHTPSSCGCKPSEACHAVSPVANPPMHPRHPGAARLGPPATSSVSASTWRRAPLATAAMGGTWCEVGAWHGKGGAVCPHLPGPPTRLPCRRGPRPPRPHMAHRAWRSATSLACPREWPTSLASASATQSAAGWVQEGAPRRLNAGAGTCFRTRWRPLTANFSPVPQVNFGSRPFAFPVPGYRALQERLPGGGDAPPLAQLSAARHLTACLARLLDVTGPDADASPTAAAALVAARSLPALGGGGDSARGGLQGAYAPASDALQEGGFTQGQLDTLRQQIVFFRAARGIDPGQQQQQQRESDAGAVEGGTVGGPRLQPGVLSGVAPPPLPPLPPATPPRGGAGARRMDLATLEGVASGSKAAGAAASASGPALGEPESLLLVAVLLEQLGPLLLEPYLVEAALLPLLRGALGGGGVRGRERLSRLLGWLCAAAEPEELASAVGATAEALGRAVRACAWRHGELPAAPAAPALQLWAALLGCDAWRRCWVAGPDWMRQLEDLLSVRQPTQPDLAGVSVGMAGPAGVPPCRQPLSSAGPALQHLPASPPLNCPSPAALPQCEMGRAGGRAACAAQRAGRRTAEGGECARVCVGVGVVVVVVVCVCVCLCVCVGGKGGGWRGDESSAVCGCAARRRGARGQSPRAPGRSPGRLRPSQPPRPKPAPPRPVQPTSSSSSSSSSSRKPALKPSREGGRHLREACRGKGGVGRTGGRGGGMPRRRPRPAPSWHPA